MINEKREVIAYGLVLIAVLASLVAFYANLKKAEEKTAEEKQWQQRFQSQWEIIGSYQHQVDSLTKETQQLEQEYFELHYKYSTCCEAVIDSSGR